VSEYSIVTPQLEIRGKIIKHEVIM